MSDAVLKRTEGRVRGVVVNSGCANAVTGERGMKDAWEMVREAGKVFGGGEDVMVMSTGVIGVPLPMSRIVDGIRSFSLSPSPTPSITAKTKTILSSDPESWTHLAKAFMTTDTFPKLRTRTFEIEGKPYRMAGIDKGAGMIHPSMGPITSSSTSSTASAARPLHATLLGCIMTDAPVSEGALQSALNWAVDRSFNSISVDGDMSTNDTVLLLANGAGGTGTPAEIEAITETHTPNAYIQFRTALTEFATELAQLVVRDGEGATKFVEVVVKVCFRLWCRCLCFYLFTDPLFL